MLVTVHFPSHHLFATPSLWLLHLEIDLEQDPEAYQKAFSASECVLPTRARDLTMVPTGEESFSRSTDGGKHERRTR